MGRAALACICATVVGWSAVAAADEFDTSRTGRFLRSETYAEVTVTLPPFTSLVGAYLSGPMINPYEFSARASAFSSLTRVVLDGLAGQGAPSATRLGGTALAHAASWGLAAGVGYATTSLGMGLELSGFATALFAVVVGEWLAPRVVAALDGWWLRLGARGLGPGLSLPRIPGLDFGAR